MIKHELKIADDLSQFKLLIFNRTIRLTGKKRQMLIKSMKKWGAVYPPLVVRFEGSLWILDGQHRHKVCQSLNLPMAYLLVLDSTGRDLTSEEIKSLLEELNTSSQTWTPKIILDRRADMYPGSVYEELKNYAKLFPHITPTALIHILTGQTGNIGDMLSQGVEELRDISNDTLRAINDITGLIGDKQKPIYNGISRKEHINDALFKLMNENSVNLIDFSLLLISAGDKFKMFWPIGVSAAHEHLLKVYEELKNL